MLLEDSYVKFLIEHDLTQSQYLLLHLLHKGRADLIREYKEKFPSDDNTMIGKIFIDDLVRKGFLAEDNKVKYRLTEKFLQTFINKHTASEEIFDLYPTHFPKDGVNIPLSAMDRNVFANLYDTAILSSVLEHIEVVKDLKYAIKHSLLNIGIEKFVKSKYWLSVRKQRKEDTTERIDTIRDHEF